MVLWEHYRVRPNVCVIVIDSLRANALTQVAGNASTPHIQALIADGVQFHNAFSHSPGTLPSHASLFSARLPHEIGIVQDGQTFASSVDVLADELSDAGYETLGVVSLAALHAPASGTAIERGFDEWEQAPHRSARASDVSAILETRLSELAGSEPFMLYAHFSDPHEPYDSNGLVLHEAEVLLDGELLETARTSESTYIEHELRVAPGIHMVDIQSEIPFRMRDFMYDAPNRVTVKPRKSDLTNSDGDVAIVIDNKSSQVQSVTLSAWLHDLPTTAEARVRYRREVEAVDAAIGRLIADLKTRDLYDNTLIVLTSDHGESLGEHGVTGHGPTLYDEVLQVPLVMKLPADSELTAQLERQSDSLARHIDVAPTILDIAGLNPMGAASGSSLLQHDSRVLIAETHYGSPTRAAYAMRDDRYKLIYFASESRFEMYDLAQDPSELDDVFRTQGHLRDKWQGQLKTLLMRVQ